MLLDSVTAGEPLIKRWIAPEARSAGRLQVPPGLVSVFVTCYGQIEHTRLLIPTVLRHSRQPFELIFIDAGSLDGTYEFLCGVAAAAATRVEVVRALSDAVLPEAVQEAVSLARGQYLALLNNDTMVTEGWLNQLVALAESAHRIGLVGPMSNCAAPPQLVEGADYDVALPCGPPERPGSRRPVGPAADERGLDCFAKRWREEHAGKGFESESIEGFCLLVKRAVLDRVGTLKAKIGLDLIDTDDLCQKAREAGYTLAVCRDLFIHNFGTRARARSGGPA